jgi:hypothetical protein
MGTLVILTLFAAVIGAVVVLFLSGQTSAAGEMSTITVERRASEVTGSGGNHLQGNG